MKRTTFPTLAALFAISFVSGGFPATISYDAKSFLLDGKRTFIFSGEFHYWRVPKGEWPDRLERIKAAGVNTVSTSVPWAVHDPQAAEIDLSDFEDFLKLCQRQNLFVIARIGPVTDADLEFGGLPYWLVARKVPGIGTNSDLYLRYAARWYNAICPLVARYQVTKGGPIILVQIDNAAPSIGLTAGVPTPIPAQPRASLPGPARLVTADHLRTLANAARERGIEIPLCINFRVWPPADVPDVLTALDTYPGWDYDSVRSALARLRERCPDRPLCVADFAPFEDRSIIGSPLPQPPDDLPAAYRATLLAILSSGACFINNYTVSGMWNFDYWRRHDIGNIYYPRSPLTVTGGFNPSYGTLRLSGQWLKSFASDFLEARELPPDATQPILANAAATNVDKDTYDFLQIRSFASKHTGYIFLQEKSAKPAAFRLRIQNLSTPGSLSIPIEEKILLSPRQAKLLMTGIELGDLTVLYSTSEILTRGTLGDLHYAIFYGDENSPGEILLSSTQPPTSISRSVRVTTEPPALRLNYTHAHEDQFARFGKTLLLITSTNRAARTWRVGSGDHSLLLISDADFVAEPHTTTAGINTTLFCKPGLTNLSAWFASPPNTVLLDGGRVAFRAENDIARLEIKTPSSPGMRLRLRQAKFAPEASLPQIDTPSLDLPELSDLASSAWQSPGFYRLLTTLQKNAVDSLIIRSNATPPLVLHVNQTPVAAKDIGKNAYSFDLRRKLADAENEIVFTLEFETVPELQVTTDPPIKLHWKGSPLLKGQWLMLFARPSGPEWKNVTLPEKPPANDIAWYALLFTLRPKPEWELPLLLNVEASDEAVLWLNGHKFVRYTSRGPEKSFPLPSSWLLTGQNLLVIAARGTQPVAAEIVSDDEHALMRHKLEVEW